MTATGATSLVHEAKVDIVTVPNLSEHLSNAATTAQLSARFSYEAALKSINNVKSCSPPASRLPPMHRLHPTAGRLRKSIESAGVASIKVIQSGGGPLIGLDREDLDHWGGVANRTFASKVATLSNDYVAACDALPIKPPTGIATLIGARAEGLLIAMPYPTAVLDVDARGAYIAQVVFAEAGWSFGQIRRGMVDQANYSKYTTTKMTVRSCDLVIFDSAYPGSEVGADCLDVNLKSGTYVCSFSYEEPDAETSLILYRIARDH